MLFCVLRNPLFISFIQLQTKMREPEKMNLRKKAKPKKIARAAPRVRSSYQVRSEMVARPPSEDEFVNVDVISSESDLDDDWESDSRYEKR